MLYVALTAAAVAVLLLVSARTGYEVHDIQDASAAGLSSMGCNPYDLPGYLHVNLSHEAGNYWKPVGSVDSCDPVDYVSLIRRRDPSVNWLKGKNIVLFGDSVDREHNEHLCWFIQGDRHMIKEGDPLSPAYPVGREKPPQDYKNPLDGSNTWPKDFYQGRPYICRVEELNLNILNVSNDCSTREYCGEAEFSVQVFHYGLRDETAHLRTFPHFYPPAEFTERLDQIVLPLVKNVARTYKTPSDVADLISITPGFWVVQRSWHDFMAGVANETDALRAAKQHELGWSNENLPDELARWIEKRLYEVLIHTAELYPEADRKPLIVWRASFLSCRCEEDLAYVPQTIRHAASYQAIARHALRASCSGRRDRSRHCATRDARSARGEAQSEGLASLDARSAQTLRSCHGPTSWDLVERIQVDRPQDAF